MSNRKGAAYSKTMRSFDLPSPFPRYNGAMLDGALTCWHKTVAAEDQDAVGADKTAGFDSVDKSRCRRTTRAIVTGRRVKAEEALGWGRADLLVPQDQLRAAAVALATEVAEAAPLAVQATRATMIAGLAELVKMQTEHELSEQAKLFTTADFREGVRAVAERRAGLFIGA